MHDINKQIIQDEEALMTERLSTVKKVDDHIIIKLLKAIDILTTSVKDIKIKDLPVVKATISVPDVKIQESSLDKLIKTIRESVISFPKKIMVEGNVKADVEFPQTQQVSGEVNVIIPEDAKESFLIKFFKQIGQTVFKVQTELPVIKTDKMNYLPVAIWNGKQFVDPTGSQGVSGNGKLFAAINELRTAVSTQSVVYAEQVRITISGSSLSLRNANTKTVVIQALKDNLGTILVNGAYELQPGQPVTMVIDNLSKIAIQGSYPPDGVCYIAS